MQTYCTNCGAPFTNGTTKCEYCGAVLPTQQPAVPQAPVYQQQNYQTPPTYQYTNANSHLPVKNKIAAALLAFFLGGLGIHKFYLGKTGEGILMLLFCWTYIPALIAFIDFILLLCMTDQAFMQKYNCRIN